MNEPGERMQWGEGDLKVVPPEELTEQEQAQIEPEADDAK